MKFDIMCGNVNQAVSPLQSRDGFSNFHFNSTGSFEL
jgi:hypothetical protein